MEKIFLSGGRGFLGKHLTAEFSKSYHLVAPTRQELDLSDTLAVDNYFDQLGPVDYVLNAAHAGGAKNSSKSEQECLYANLKVFRNMLQHRKEAKRFIQFGSGAEYSKPFHKKNMLEENAGEVLPKDAYGLSKFLSGQVIESIGTTGQSVNLRILGVFGPYEDYQVRFISNAILRSLFNLPIVVKQNAEFDYVYVKDFVRIINYYISNPAPYVSYNITAGQPITLIELAEIVRSLTGNNHGIIVNNSDIKESYTGSNKRLLSFLPRDFVFTPITTAIAELIMWYEKNISLIKKELL